MKTTPTLLAVAIVLLFGGFFHASAQSFPWNDFERRTLSQLVKINNDEDADDLKRFPDKGQYF